HAVGGGDLQVALDGDAVGAVPQPQRRDPEPAHHSHGYHLIDRNRPARRARLRSPRCASQRPGLLYDRGRAFVHIGIRRAGGGAVPHGGSGAYAMGDLNWERVIAAGIVVAAALAVAVLLRLLTGRLFKRAGDTRATWDD